MDQGPMVILREYERRARRCAAPVPEMQEALPQWLGVDMGGERILLSLAKVQEVVKPPTLTRVPGAQAWLKGVAHVRGRLLTAVDLGGLLRCPVEDLGPAARLVVLRETPMPLGLLVRRVWGLQRPDPVTYPKGAAHVAGWLEPHVAEVCQVGGEPWPVLDLTSVVDSPRMMHAAIQGKQ